VEGGRKLDRPLTPEPATVQELEGKVKELEKLLMWNESLKYSGRYWHPANVLGLAPDASMEEAKARGQGVDAVLAY